MAHSLAVTTLLLVVAAASVAWPFAHAAGYPDADAPATLAESPAVVVSPSDVPGEEVSLADAPGEAVSLADAPSEAVSLADAPNTVEATGEGPAYVDMVIKNPVESNDAPPGRADGLPVDPTPDGQLWQR
ncbi:hypothetical protein ABZP36_025363 [Zizania latifolia]